MTLSLLTKTLVFWHPAVNDTAIIQKDLTRFKIDKEALLIRSIAIPALAGLAAYVLLKASLLLLVPSFIFAAAVLWNFENWRATKLLDQLAVELFNSSDIVPSDAVYYATKSLTTIQMLMNFPETLKKPDISTGLNLTETILKDLKICNDFEKKEKFSNGLKALIDAGTFHTGGVNHVLLSILLENELEYRELIVHAIENDALVRNDFTDQMVRKLWSEVNECRNADVAFLLIQKGFEIDVKNKDGRTLLYEAVEKNALGEVCFLLKYGAKLPEDIEESSASKKPLSSYLRNKPTFRRALGQVKELQGQDLLRYKDDDPSSYHFWKPAIKIGASGDILQINNNTIMKRVFAISLSAMLMLKALSMVPTSGILPLTFTAIAIPIVLIYYWWEYLRVTREMHALALKEFSNPFPSSNIAKHIASDSELMKELLSSSSTAAFKLDETGKTLWDYICKNNGDKEGELIGSNRFTIFKALANAHFVEYGQHFLSEEEKKNHFLKLLKSNQYLMIEYVLKDCKMRVGDFDDAFQFECWQNVNTPEMVRLFVQFGFNINVRSAEKLTPLFWFVTNERSPLLIKALLENGADVNAIVKSNSKKNCISDLTENRVLRELLFGFLNRA